jgi:phosphohistidine swiveling domain-containing protein
VVVVVPIDGFADGWYPGFQPQFDEAPWVVEPFRLFSPQDEQRFWFLDFHWPRGLTPMGLVWIEDGYGWGSQLAAEGLPLPAGRGLAQRFAGTHVYAAAIEVTDGWEIAERTCRAQVRLTTLIDNFDAVWAERRSELERWWLHLSRADVSGLSLTELRGYIIRARRFLKRSAEIHFELMYPLLINYLTFYRSCVDMGIDASQIAKFLQGYDTKIMETDRALWHLAERARQMGLVDVFAVNVADNLRNALSEHGGRASTWCAEFDDVMQAYGHRAEGAFDVALPSWLEDPTPALAMIKSFLKKGSGPDLFAARREAETEREAAVEAARSSLTLQKQRVFDAGLASCQAANFPWWQDEHNYYIDLRVALPMRWACLQIADRFGADLPGDTLFLFWPELMAVLDGVKQYDSFRGLVQDRRQYYEYWSGRRGEMPKFLGTLPETVADPILLEVFGVNQDFLHSVRASQPGTADATTTMQGIPAAQGIARGIARVLLSADALDRVRSGEVLVCESISPNWTPVFGKIAACVCDSGGMLSHAAIVGREYRVPTVTAVGVATVVIRDGDEIEVNGTTGVVTIYRSS